MLVPLWKFRALVTLRGLGSNGGNFFPLKSNARSTSVFSCSPVSFARESLKKKISCLELHVSDALAHSCTLVSDNTDVFNITYLAKFSP